MCNNNFQLTEAVAQRCSVKKVFSEISKKIHGQTRCQSLLLKKVAGLSLQLYKRRLWHRLFPVNFVKFLRTPFYIEHFWWQLLFLYPKHKTLGKDYEQQDIGIDIKTDLVTTIHDFLQNQNQGGRGAMAPHFIRNRTLPRMFSCKFTFVTFSKASKTFFGPDTPRIQSGPLKNIRKM